MIELRDATPEDVEAVTTLFLRCWRESYATVLPAHVIEVFDEAGASELWRRAFVSPRPGTRGVVATDASRVVGVIRMGRDPDEPDAGHVFSLYVDPAAQGGGIGRRLLDSAVVWSRDQGLTTATLWVFEANRRARTFYAFHGWQPDGATRTEAEFGEPEIRLRRTL